MNAQELLTISNALLLDFDGPACSIFSGIPAQCVAEHLRVVLVDNKNIELPQHVANTSDPFNIFRYAATLGINEAKIVESALTACKLEAVASATITPGAHRLICDWHASARPLAIISNNSAIAIRKYLLLHDLYKHVKYVSARSDPNAELLKPGKHLLDRALVELRIDASVCTLIGDSMTDIQAAHSAGVPILGYANKPEKLEEMERARATSVTRSLVGLIPHIA